MSQIKLIRYSEPEHGVARHPELERSGGEGSCFGIFLLALLFSLPKTSWANEDHPKNIDGDFNIVADCLFDQNIDDGAKQECLRLSDLKLKLSKQLNQRLKAHLTLNPFGIPLYQYRHSPFRSNVPTLQDADMGIIDDYKLSWEARPGLSISLGRHEGAAKISPLTNVSLAPPFFETSWDQTAFSVEYQLGANENMGVEFIAGNGEGENGQNLDVQQYVGVRLFANPLEGINLEFGMSFDGNSAGSKETDYIKSRHVEKCGSLYTDAGGIDVENYDAEKGYSTQRLAFALSVNEKLLYINGLKLGMAWARYTLSDLDKERNAYPNLNRQLSCDAENIDPSSFFVEDPAGELANTIEKTILNFGMSYDLSESYTFGFDIKSRTVSSDIDFVSKCIEFDEDVCTTKGEKFNSISDIAWAVGLSMALEPQLALQVDYGNYSYDDLYDKINYRSPNKLSKEIQYINLRIAYGVN